MFKSTTKKHKASHESCKVNRSRVGYVALNDDRRITMSRTRKQNVALFMDLYGMPQDKAEDFADAIEKVFYYGSL